MKPAHVLIALGLGLVMANTTTAQSPKVEARKVTAADEVLARQVGKWNTTVTVYGKNGEKEKVYKSVSSSRLGCEGRCLIWELKSEVGEGQPYQGHGIEVFDPVAKKYKGTWTDATATGFTTSEYAYNTEKNTFAGTFQATNRKGVATKVTMTGDFQNPKERVMTMWGAGPANIRKPIIQCAMVQFSNQGDPAP